MVCYDSFPCMILGILYLLEKTPFCSAFFPTNHPYPLPFFFLLCYDEE